MTPYEFFIRVDIMTHHFEQYEKYIKEGAEFEKIDLAHQNFLDHIHDLTTYCRRVEATVGITDPNNPPKEPPVKREDK